MAVLLKNARFVNWQTLEINDVNILVEEGQEGKIYFSETGLQEKKEVETIDCSGKIVTKSFAVGHHHIYSALARGMGAPKKNPENFFETLKYIWWTLDKSLDKEMIEASALSTAIACAKAGNTFVIDHHASPFFIDGSLEIISEALNKVGLGHLLCYEITDRDGLDKADLGLEETENFLQNNQGLIGLHASFTVGDRTMRKAADLMEKYRSGFHIHIAEDRYDQDHSLVHYGKRIVDRLSDYGVLESSKTILAHCLHLSKNEKKQIEKSKAFVVQNTESNLNNHVGFFSGEGLGDRIMLGTDGMHSDMLRSAQQAFFVGQSFDSIDFQGIYNRFRNVHNYLKTNQFSGDGDNNLVILDYKSPTPINQKNFLGHFVFGFQAADVSHVISNGKVIMKDRKMMTVDEADVMAFAREQAKRLWKNVQK